MDLIADIPVLGTFITMVVPFLIVLGVVVFVHEFGHYIVGRWTGIKAEVFSIGFGPKLVGWTDRAGTHWQVAALPLGGFVKFVGDMDPASAEARADDDLAPEDRAHAFHNAGLGARAATVAAGPVFNFILSILLVAAIGLASGRPSTEPVLGELTGAVAESAFAEGDRVVSIAGEPTETLDDVVGALTRLDGQAVPAVVERDGRVREIELTLAATPVIRAVLPATPAARAGVEPGDVVLAIGGQPIETYHDLRVIAANAPAGEPVELTLERAGETLTLPVMPDMLEREHPETGERMMLPTLGISGGLDGIAPRLDSMGPVEALVYGAERTWGIIAVTVGYLYDILGGRADASQLGGPIGIAKISGEAAAAGVGSIVWLIALLSTSIGLINLFPIPILDGGHLMFYALEGLRGRPVSSGAMRVGNMIGLSLVLLLMVFATYNDLLRI
ncbi:MAG TPA: RIP metalloprotease RseP [Thermohalobaculum sp.]|nr:RIP metalloprotease RseP [Thermohalobaculum sp.]